MRSSTVLIAALAAATPTLAAPFASVPQYAKRDQATTPQGSTKSGVEESGAYLPFGYRPPAANPWVWRPSRYTPPYYPGRYYARADDDLQSGASFWGSIWRALPTVLKVANGIINKRGAQDLSAREFEELFARELNQQLARGIVARAGDEQSGAFWGEIWRALPTVIKIANGIINKRDVQGLSTREFEELFTRELNEQFSREIAARADDEQSGAFWGAIWRALPTVLRVANGIINKRDVQELSAREFEELFSRELEAELKRELSARGDDESGAFDWGSLVSAIPSVISSFFKRDDLDALFARAVLEARTLNELD